MKTNCIITLLLCCISMSALAQHHATHVDARQVGKTIEISYDLDNASFISVRMRYAGIDFNDKKTNTVYEGDFFPELELKNVSGDVGFVTAGKGKRVSWDVLKDYPDGFIRDDVQFFVDADSPYSGYKTFFLGQYGVSFVPQHSGGFMIGQILRKFGWYVNFRSNFVFTKSTNGMTTLTKEPEYFYTGKTRKSMLVANAGLTMDCLGWSKKYDQSFFGPYLGFGYGYRYMLWQTTDGDWVEYKPTAMRGANFDAGLIGAVKGYTMALGVSTINFDYLELEFSFGWTIPHKKK